MEYPSVKSSKVTFRKPAITLKYLLTVKVFSRLMPAVSQNVPSKSLSVMAVSNVGGEGQFAAAAASHRTAKSCDLDGEPSRHYDMNCFNPESQPYYCE